MARFHGLSHVLMTRHAGGKSGWLEENPWVIPLSQNPPKMLETFSKTMQEQQKKQFFVMAKVLEDGDESKGDRFP